MRLREKFIILTALSGLLVANEEIAAASQALAKLAGDMQEAVGKFQV